VTLVNPRPIFVPRLRLHQLVGGAHDAVVEYREVFAARASDWLGPSIRGRETEV
jgi:hypothetical protein